MLAQLQEEFISRLEAWYGPWERTTSKFGTSSFGKIAEDLCISPSQFSKLISGTATDGMYVRTLRNIDRLVQEDKLRQEKIELEGLYRQDQDRIRRLSGQRVRLGRRSILLLALFGIFILVMGYLVVGYRSKDSVLSALGLTAHPLSIFLIWVSTSLFRRLICGIVRYRNIVRAVHTKEIGRWLRHTNYLCRAPVRLVCTIWEKVRMYG